MIIDCHIHLCLREGDGNGKDRSRRAFEELLAECDRLGVDRICVSAGGPRYGIATNDDVAWGIEQYPDRVIGQGMHWLDSDEPEAIDELHARGFRGLKTACPARNYDDPAYFPAYERAAERNMPILFHLGVFGRGASDGEYSVSAARMQPIYLDTIARWFPGLPLIGAHFGNPWYDVSAELARIHKNIYFDMSGSTLMKKSPSFFKELFWWGDHPECRVAVQGRSPFEGILFGSDATDTALDELEKALLRYQKLLDGCDLSASIRSAIMGETAGKLYGTAD